MKVALWAEIRRLSEIENLTGRMIARRLHCSRHTVAAALELTQPPAQAGSSQRSLPAQAAVLRDFSQSSRPSGDAATSNCLARKRWEHQSVDRRPPRRHLEAALPELREWAAKMPSKRTNVNLWESAEVP